MLPILFSLSCQSPTLNGHETGALPTEGDADVDADSDTDTDTAVDTAAPDAPLLDLVINELMSDNEGVVVNDNGDAWDWIELYNPTAKSLDLSGCGVSDDWTDPLLYPLPDGTVVPPGGHLLLWASGTSLPEGVELPFRLDADGEGVGLFTPGGEIIDWVGFGPQDTNEAWARLPDGGSDWELMPVGTPGTANRRMVAVTEEVVSSGALWRYWDARSSPGDGWTERAFDDSDWAQGPSPLGYGDVVETTVSYGSDASDKNPACWFRTTFGVEEGLEGIIGGTLSLRYDDGIAAFLDGEEVARRNLPDGELTAHTYASATVSGDAETSWANVSLDSRSLSAGAAVLATEVHQAGATSSDIVMDAVLRLDRVVPEEER